MRRDGGPDQFELPAHFVLSVKAEGTEVIFDGTLQQFGWDSESWLQPWDEVLEAKVETRAGPFWDDGPIKAETLNDSATRCDDGFWVVAKERMRDLCVGLNWEELRSLEEVERLERVKKQADEKFAGTYEEAFQRSRR